MDILFGALVLWGGNYYYQKTKIKRFILPMVMGGSLIFYGVLNLFLGYADKQLPQVLELLILAVIFVSVLATLVNFRFFNKAMKLEGPPKNGAMDKKGKKGSKSNKGSKI